MEDQFLDLLILANQPLESIADCKDYLQSIDHEQKDNSSFIYNFWQYCNEPVCFKN